MRSTSVVFPDPLAPTIAITSPRRAVNETSSSTGSRSYANVTRSKVISRSRLVTLPLPLSPSYSPSPRPPGAARLRDRDGELRQARHAHHAPGVPVAGLPEARLLVFLPAEGL